MFTVYVLQSKSSSRIYIGQTENLEKRLRQHNDKDFDKRSYTKLSGKEWEVVYKEGYKTRGEAINREKYLKSHHGRDYIRGQIEGR